MSFQKTMTLGPELERRMEALQTKIRELGSEAPAWIAALDSTTLSRLVMCLGLEALEKEHRLR